MLNAIIFLEYIIISYYYIAYCFGRFSFFSLLLLPFFSQFDFFAGFIYLVLVFTKGQTPVGFGTKKNKRKTTKFKFRGLKTNKQTNNESTGKLSKTSQFFFAQTKAKENHGTKMADPKEATNK